ncbi:MAG: hypothetical protein Q8J78_03635, partial [Moraxellaceae bacterium]|nr:hypothetical protein [Moraxellaceae bacterium]
AAWLASLVGAPGADGADGDDGADGPPALCIVSLQVTGIGATGDPLAVGDGQAALLISSSYTGKNLVDALAAVTTTSSSGDITIQLRRARGGVNMLSTPITILAGQTASTGGGATQPVVDAANDDVVAGDVIYIDVDGAGTGAKGLLVTMEFA